MKAGLKLGKNQIRSSFSAAADSYDGVAELQRRIGLQLLDALQNDPAGTVLDLGCGTGFLTGRLLPSEQITRMLAVDIALPMLEKARRKLAGQAVAYICADAGQLPFAGQSIDQAVSNLALQWCPNLDQVFAGLKRVLKPGGQFAFAIFASQTLQELKVAWAQVDDYKHVNDFYKQQELECFLQSAGFTDIHSVRQLHVSYYDTAISLMQELKQLGAQHVPGRNPRLTGKASLQAMLAAYGQQRQEQGIPATFEVIIISAKA